MRYLLHMWASAPGDHSARLFAIAPDSIIFLSMVRLFRTDTASFTLKPAKEFVLHLTQASKAILSLTPVDRVVHLPFS